MTLGKAVPVLPARSLDETLAFYQQLGFCVDYSQHEPHGYAIVTRDGLELHFFAFPTLNPEINYAGCYWRVQDASALFDEFQSAGVTRLGELEDKPWGMREFHIIDPSDNLVRIGQAISD